MRSAILASTFAAYLFIVQGPLAAPMRLTGGFGEFVETIGLLHSGGLKILFAQ